MANLILILLHIISKPSIFDTIMMSLCLDILLILFTLILPAPHSTSLLSLISYGLIKVIEYIFNNKRR